MEIHQLRYFVAVSEDGSFSRAADRLRVAQPSLSQGISKLETAVGSPLFDRLSRGVTATAAGRRLLPYARRILADLADAQRCLGGHGDALAGTVAIGIIPTIAPYVVRPLLQGTARACPGVTVHFTEAVTERLERALDDGGLDFAIVSTCRRGAGLHREPWAAEPLVAVVPEGHRLAGHGAVRPHQLRGEPFLSLQETHCLAQQIGRWCIRHGLRPRDDLSADGLATVLALVAAGQGVSLCPLMAMAREGGRGCAFLPFADAAPVGDITAIGHPARFGCGAARTVADVARAVAKAAAAG